MKRKRISKKMLYTILGVLTIFVSTLTVAYSVLSATLNITGRAAVTNSSWNITVSKRDVLESVGYSEEELERILSFLDGKRIYNGIVLKSAELIKEPTISGTTISDLKIAFNKPGDVLALMYNVTNNGTIPAKIESIVQNTPSFSSSINNEYDIELISSAFSYDNNLEKTDGEDINEGYILCPGETIILWFTALYDEDATEVPSGDVTISNLGGTVNFVQTNKNACVN